MKIIGKTDRGFILEGGEDEMFNLIGFFYSGERGAPRLRVGDEILVGKMYGQLYNLANRKNTLSAMAKELRGLAELLELKQPIIFVEEKKDEG